MAIHEARTGTAAGRYSPLERVGKWFLVTVVVVLLLVGPLALTQVRYGVHLKTTNHGIDVQLVNVGEALLYSGTRCGVPGRDSRTWFSPSMAGRHLVIHEWRGG